MIIGKVTISDRGDSSVGIQGGEWEMDMKGMEIDDDNLELLRQDLMKLYSSWNEFPADFCEFDFETAKRIADEKAFDDTFGM